MVPAVVHGVHAAATCPPGGGGSSVPFAESHLTETTHFAEYWKSTYIHCEPKKHV